jgi:hypothetical protein
MDTYLLVCRSIRDSVEAGAALPEGAAIDVCHVCGETVSITVSGQKRRRENPDVIVVCSPCGLDLALEAKSRGRETRLELGSPECEEALKRSAGARANFEKFKAT